MARTWPSRRPSRMPCTSWSSHCIFPAACRSQLQCIWCPRRAHTALPGQARWLCRRQLLGPRCLDAQVRRSCAWAADCCSWGAHRDRLVWPRCAGVMVVAAHNCRRRRKYQIEQGGVDGRGSSSSTLTHRAWDWVCRRFDPPRRARAHDMADVAVWAWCEAAAAQSVPYLCPSRRVSPGSSWRRGRWLAAGKLMSAAKENGWKLKDQWMLPGHLCMCVCVSVSVCQAPLRLDIRLSQQIAPNTLANSTLDSLRLLQRHSNWTTQSNRQLNALYLDAPDRLHLNSIRAKAW